MIKTVLLLVLTTGSGPYRQTVRFDVLELNHMQPGKFRQIIVWDWSPDLGLICQGWVMADDCRQLSHRPPYRFRITGGPNRGIIIEAPIFRETWTDIDPEVANRRVYPIDQRRRWHIDRPPIQYQHTSTDPHENH